MILGGVSDVELQCGGDGYHIFADEAKYLEAKLLGIPYVKD